MFTHVNHDDTGVHFSCVTKNPGLISVKTRTDLARLRLSPSYRLMAAQGVMKVLAAVNRTIEPDVKVGVLGDGSEVI